MEETLMSDAEDLRLRGNDAFGTGDYKNALSLYQRSVAHSPQPKTYGNIAATLCKLDRYREAAEAAERSTALDPKWAKGWWRRGVVAELLKLFMDANKYFALAVELDPKEQTFRKALAGSKKRLNVTKGNVMELTAGEEPSSIMDSPGVRAWFRVQQAMRGSTFTMSMRFAATQETEGYPTSVQYLFQGMNQWVGGMKGAIANLSMSVSREAHMILSTLQQQNPRSAEERDEILLEVERQLGGYPSQNQDMANLVSGYAHLGGLGMVLETSADAQLCPPGALLLGTPYAAMAQPLAMMGSIDVWVGALLSPRYGFDGRTFVMSKGVLDASKTYFSNLRVPYPHRISNLDQDPSPEDAISFIKEQLGAGKTWNQMRPYVSLVFRGTYLYSFVLRTLVKQVAWAYQLEKWAHKFINLADKEFHVTELKAFDEMGSAFRPSLRIGLLMSELQSLLVLRGDRMNGPYSMEDTLNLCVEISETAQQMEPDRGREELTSGDYFTALDDVAFRRKPLALSHSTIALGLLAVYNVFSLEEFKQIAAHHGFIESIDSDCDPYAVIADHYRIAAENTLPDEFDGATYWWGYACHMAMASPESSYTLGQLNKAVDKAQAAEKARDVGLFDENKESNGPFEIIAKLTVTYFHDKSDSFVLPQVKLVRSKGQAGNYKSHLEVDNDVFCHNFHEYEQKQLKLEGDWYSRHGQLMDTTEVEKTYGASFEGIPPLETLCIRELHKSGCSYAKGETDGAVIHYKAMMAEIDKNDKKNKK